MYLYIGTFTSEFIMYYVSQSGGNYVCSVKMYFQLFTVPFVFLILWLGQVYSLGFVI